MYQAKCDHVEHTNVLKNTDGVFILLCPSHYPTPTCKKRLTSAVMDRKGYWSPSSASNQPNFVMRATSWGARMGKGGVTAAFPLPHTLFFHSHTLARSHSFTHPHTYSHSHLHSNSFSFFLSFSLSLFLSLSLSLSLSFFLFFFFLFLSLSISLFSLFFSLLPSPSPLCRF